MHNTIQKLGVSVFFLIFFGGGGGGMYLVNILLFRIIFNDKDIYNLTQQYSTSECSDKQFF